MKHNMKLISGAQTQIVSMRLPRDLCLYIRRAAFDKVISTNNFSVTKLEHYSKKREEKLTPQEEVVS